MATWTQQELTNKVLELIGIKAQGQSASSDDYNLAFDTITGAYRELRRDRVAPFAISSIPEWAQVPLRDILAADIAPVFGIQDGRFEGRASMGRRRLERQVVVDDPEIPPKAYYY